MSGWKLPGAVEAFLGAARANDAERMLRALGGAVVVDAGRERHGEAVLAWTQAFCAEGQRPIRCVHSQWHAQSIAMTVLLGADESGQGEVVDWIFGMDGPDVRRLQILPRPARALPAAVAAFVEAANREGLDELLSAFVDDAIVNDQLTDYWGKAAIREWAARDIVGQHLRLRVVSCVDHYGHAILTAYASGDFDHRGLPDPLVLVFYVSTACERIVQLIILRNLAGV